MLLIRYYQANGSGGNCHWRDSLLPTGTKRRDTPCYTGPHGETPGSGRRLKGQEEDVTVAFLVVSSGKAREDKSIGLGLTSLNNFTRFWGIRTVSRCLSPVLRWLGQGDNVLQYWSSVRTRQMRWLGYRLWTCWFASERPSPRQVHCYL